MIGLLDSSSVQSQPHIEDDSVRVQVLIDLAKECRYNDPEDLKRYNQEALKLSEKNEYTLGEGLALKGMGSYYFDRAEYDSAIYYFNRAELIFGNLGDNSELTDVIGSYCFLCVAQGEYNKAFEASLRALEIAEESKDEYNIEKAFTFIGFIYYSIGKQEEALVYYEQANKIAIKRNDLESLSSIKSKMAMVYDRLGDYEAAIKLFNEASEIIKNAGNPQLISFAMFNKAESYRCQGNMKLAIETYFKSYKITSGLYDQVGKVLLLSRISYSYLDQLKKGYSMDQLDKLINTAGFNSIDHLLLSTIEKLESSNNKNDLIFFHESLIELYKQRGDYNRAFYCNNNLIALKDTVAKINRSIALSQLSYQYELEEKQKELILLELKSTANEEKINIQRQRIIMIIILVVLLMIIGVGVWSRIYTVKKLRVKVENTNKLLNKEKHRAEQGEQFKERFLANLSHEIRTPMNAIMGITNLLIKNKHYKEQKEYLNAISISSRHLLILINDILDLSKLEAGMFEIEKSMFSILDCFKQIEEELGEVSREKGLQLIFDEPVNVPDRVLGDQHMLYQILSYLIRNAIEFTAEGKIEVDVVPVTTETTEHTFLLQFVVKDTGVGIRKDIREKIFSEFIGDLDFDKRYIDQSGLGLLITRQMIQLQGGNIRVETQEGKGSSFIFEIPYERNPVNEITEENILSESVNVKDLDGINILLVEDNEFNVIVATDELEAAIENVNIQVAENGRIALQLVQKISFDIILMDIQMPVLNGFDAAIAIRKLKGQKGKIPIIAMTANNTKAELEKCYSAGMNDYISKPFETEMLISKIRLAYNTVE